MHWQAGAAGVERVQPQMERAMEALRGTAGLHEQRGRRQGAAQA